MFPPLLIPHFPPVPLTTLTKISYTESGARKYKKLSCRWDNCLIPRSKFIADSEPMGPSSISVTYTKTMGLFRTLYKFWAIFSFVTLTLPLKVTAGRGFEALLLTRSQWALCCCSHTWSADNSLDATSDFSVMILFLRPLKDHPRS